LGCFNSIDFVPGGSPNSAPEAFFAAAVFFFLLAFAMLFVRAEGICTTCGHDMRDLRVMPNRCPECNTPLPKT